MVTTGNVRPKGASVRGLVDPGPVDSRIGQNNPGWTADLLRVVMKTTFPSADRAARTAVYLACADEVASASGGYFRYGQRKVPRIETRDLTVGADLWKISEQMTRVRWK